MEGVLTLYVLMQDVENPMPDKRFRYDWTKAAKWAKGTKFEIERIGEVEVIRQMGRRVSQTRSMSMARHPEQFSVLRPHLAPAPAPNKRIKASEIMETLVNALRRELGPDGHAYDCDATTTEGPRTECSARCIRVRSALRMAGVEVVPENISADAT